MGGALPALLPGFPVKILDGNCIAGTEHRIRELRKGNFLRGVSIKELIEEGRE